jgi:hypothetical protein
MWVKYIVIIVAIISFGSCKSSKQTFDPNTTKKEFIAFGLGGGFTGKVLKYYIVKDGSIYSPSEQEFKKMGVCPKRLTNQVFSNYNSLEMDKITLNEPGNKYYFIESHLKHSTNKITWGKDPLNNPYIETYFDILMNTVKVINKN